MRGEAGRHPANTPWGGCCLPRGALTCPQVCWVARSPACLSVCLGDSELPTPQDREASCSQAQAGRLGNCLSSFHHPRPLLVRLGYQGSISARVQKEEVSQSQLSSSPTTLCPQQPEMKRGKGRGELISGCHSSWSACISWPPTVCTGIVMG